MTVVHRTSKVIPMTNKLKELFLKWLEENRPDFYRDKEKQMEFEHELNRKTFANIDFDHPISLGESYWAD